MQRQLATLAAGRHALTRPNLQPCSFGGRSPERTAADALRSLFTFAAAGSESAGGVEAHVLVRGFRKFTGLTDEDEDEESAAARQNESFLY